MGSLSIQKGKRAEREVARMLNERIIETCNRLRVEPFKVLRNLKQTQSGGFDLDGIEWLAIEIKHHKVVSLGPWWEQCLRQAVDGREPILIWKQHGGKWQVRMWVRVLVERGPDGTASRWVKTHGQISIEAFMDWFEMRLETELLKEILKEGA